MRRSHALPNAYAYSKYDHENSTTRTTQKGTKQELLETCLLEPLFLLSPPVNCGCGALNIFRTLVLCNRSAGRWKASELSRAGRNLVTS